MHLCNIRNINGLDIVIVQYCFIEIEATFIVIFCRAHSSMIIGFSKFFFHDKIIDVMNLECHVPRRDECTRH